MKCKKTIFGALFMLLLTSCSLFGGSGSKQSSSKSQSVEEISSSEPEEIQAPFELPGTDFVVSKEQKDAGTVYHFDTANKKLTITEYSNITSYCNNSPYQEPVTLDYFFEEFEVLATRNVYKKTAYTAVDNEYFYCFFYEDVNGAKGNTLLRFKCEKSVVNYDEAKYLATPVDKLEDTFWDAFKLVKGRVYRTEENVVYYKYLQTEKKATFEIRFGEAAGADVNDYYFRIFMKAEGQTEYKEFIFTNATLQGGISLYKMDRYGIYTTNKAYVYTVTGVNADATTIKLDKEKGEGANADCVNVTWNSMEFHLVSEEAE